VGSIIGAGDDFFGRMRTRGTDAWGLCRTGYGRRDLAWKRGAIGDEVNEGLGRVEVYWKDAKVLERGRGWRGAQSGAGKLTNSGM